MLAEHGEPVIIDDASTSVRLPDILAKPSDIRSLFFLPLITASGVIGFILAPRSTSAPWASSDMLPAVTFAAHAATVIENVQLQRSANETAALQETERLKRRFITAVSHDLQSPLTAIRASVEGLLNREEMPFSDIQKRMLNTIAGQTNRLEQLVGQLLDLSRIEAGMLALDCEWIDLSAVIADTVAEFAELYCEYQVERDVASDLPWLYIDRSRIVQVLWNLLENARKYAASRAFIWAA